MPPPAARVAAGVAAFVALYKLLVIYRALDARKHAFVLGRSGPLWLAVLRRAWSDFLVRLLVGTQEVVGAVLPNPFVGLNIASAYFKNPSACRNVAYGQRERHHLDVYQPAHSPKPAAASAGAGVNAGSAGHGHATVAPAARGAPVILFVHGGAWSWGHKWQYAAVGEALAESGFLVLVVNYHVYPFGTVDEQVDDVRKAVLWAAGNVARFGGDPNSIHISGHSSGAHLCALLLMREAVRHFHGHDSSAGLDGPLVHLADEPAAASGGAKSAVLRAVKSFIGLAGVFDVDDHYKWEAGRKYGLLDGVASISPMAPSMACAHEDFRHVSPTAVFHTMLAELPATHSVLPPIALIHGTADGVVPVDSSRKFAGALRLAHHHVDLIEYEGVGHADPIIDLTTRSGTHARLIADIRGIVRHAHDIAHGKPAAATADVPVPSPPPVPLAPRAPPTPPPADASPAAMVPVRAARPPPGRHSEGGMLDGRAAAGKRRKASRLSVDALVEAGRVVADSSLSGRRPSGGVRYSVDGGAWSASGASGRRVGDIPGDNDDAGSTAAAAAHGARPLADDDAGASGAYDDDGEDEDAAGVLCRARDLTFSELPVTGPRPNPRSQPASAAVALGNSVFASGVVELAPLSIKDPETSAENVIVFCVKSCKSRTLELCFPSEDTLRGAGGSGGGEVDGDDSGAEEDPRLLLSAGDHFCVPADTVYSLRNLAEHTPAAMTFVVIKDP